MKTFDKKEYDKEYRKENYKEIRFWFQKNQLDNATNIANAHGYDTINAYAKALLEEALAKESRGGQILTKARLFILHMHLLYFAYAHSD